MRARIHCARLAILSRNNAMPAIWQLGTQLSTTTRCPPPLPSRMALLECLDWLQHYTLPACHIIIPLTPATADIRKRPQLGNKSTFSSHIAGAAAYSLPRTKSPINIIPTMPSAFKKNRRVGGIVDQNFQIKEWKQILHIIIGGAITYKIVGVRPKITTNRCWLSSSIK